MHVWRENGRLEEKWFNVATASVNYGLEALAPAANGPLKDVLWQSVPGRNDPFFEVVNVCHRTATVHLLLEGRPYEVTWSNWFEIQTSRTT